MNFMKKTLYLIIATAMLLSTMSVTVFAASGVAEINGASYDSLAEALAEACKSEGKVTIELTGDVEWETGAEHGSTPLVPAESKAIVTINGNDYTFTATGSGVGPIRAANDTVLTFNNVNFVDESVSYAENAWEFTYLEFGGKLKFVDCDFEGEIQLDSDVSEFENCTFESNEESVYAVWLENGIATFDGCYFTGYRGLKMHEAYGTDIASVSVESCKFENISKKPGIAIGNLNDTTSVKISNSEFINVQAGDQGGYIFETDTDVSTFDFESAENSVFNGTNSLAYTKEVDGYVRVWGQATANPSESFVLKLYSNETLLATTTLNNIGNIINGATKDITWNFCYPQSNDEYWTTTWEEGHPNSANQPTKVELYVDNVLVATTDAKMCGPDNLNPVIWKDLGGVKYIVTGLEGEGTEENPYLINNLDELKWFRDQVDKCAQNGSTQFEGKFFKLTSDINLDEDGDGIGENWNPIGTMSSDKGSFKGVFDGDNHTISNLYIESTEAKGIGLFSRTVNKAQIKNLTINNVTIKASKSSTHIGTVVGNSYASTKLTNVHVTGKIDIYGKAYIGGISGHGYVVMDNCSVKAEGIIKGEMWCIGGILGYAGEGSTNIMNSTVEGVGDGLLLTSAAGGIGTIVGMAEDNDGKQPISGSNLSAKNVDIKTFVGGYGTAYSDYALGYLYGGNETSILTGTLEVDDVTFETNEGATNPPVVDAIATVGTKVFFSLQDALNAAEDGDTVTLLRDVKLKESVVFDKEGTFTLDGNGKTITQAAGYKDTQNGLIMLGNTLNNDASANTRKYTVKNVVFDGIEGYSVIRSQGVDLTFDNTWNITS